MKYLAIPILALALMGQSCPAQDAQIRTLLGDWCPAIDTADAHYEAIRNRVSVRTQATVDAVVDNFQAICAGRATATTITILVQGGLAVDAISRALREARSNGASVAYQGDLNKLEGMLTKLKKDIYNVR